MRIQIKRQPPVVTPNSGAKADPHSGAKADPRRWRALAVLGLIQFMLVVDTLVLSSES